MRLDIQTVLAVFATLICSSQALQNHRNPTLKARSPSADEGWIDLSVGVRAKKDESSAAPIEKRSTNPVSTPVLLKRNPETGNLVWPRSFSEALTLAKRHVPDGLRSSLHRRTALVRRGINVVITWYGGHDLLFPACFSESDNWAPTDDSMVAAVTIEWPGKPPCGSFVNIQHHANPHRNITVRIVDSCGGCAPGRPHIDLTIGAFEKLYDQQVGMVEGLRARIVSCPPGIDENWTQEVTDRYGPQKTIHQREQAE